MLYVSLELSASVVLMVGKSEFNIQREVEKEKPVTESSDTPVTFLSTQTKKFLSLSQLCFPLIWTDLKSPNKYMIHYGLISKFRSQRTILFFFMS